MGFGGFGAIVGGAMQGFGDALEKRALAEREMAMKMLEQGNAEQLREQGMGVEHGYNTQENDQRSANDRENRTLSEDRADQRSASDHTFRLDEEKIRAKNASNLEGQREGRADNRVTQYVEDADGNTVGLTATGKAVKTGVSMGGLPKRDKDLLSSLEPQFSQKVTTEDDEGNKTTGTKLDSKGLAQRLTDMGRPDLAKMYGGVPAPRVPMATDGTNNFGSPNYKAPKAQLPAGMDSNAALSQAKAAIAAGKDRNAVIQRLQSYGIDPSGL